MTKTWLGRGLDDVPGKPFGWAWYRERDEIGKRLVKRHGPVGESASAFGKRERLITRIQERLHKYRPTLKQRQAAWRARQPKPDGAGLRLTWEELERLVDLFTGANDPVTASIAAKAAEALAKKDA